MHCEKKAKKWFHQKPGGNHLSAYFRNWKQCVNYYVIIVCSVKFPDLQSRKDRPPNLDEKFITKIGLFQVQLIFDLGL